MVNKLEEFIFVERISFCEACNVDKAMKSNFIVLEVLKDLLSEFEPVCDFVKSWNI